MSYLLAWRCEGGGGGGGVSRHVYTRGRSLSLALVVVAASREGGGGVPWLLFFSEFFFASSQISLASDSSPRTLFVTASPCVIIRTRHDVGEGDRWGLCLVHRPTARGKFFLLGANFLSSLAFNPSSTRTGGARAPGVQFEPPRPPCVCVWLMPTTSRESTRHPFR